jgi:hypothetical protein
MIKKKQILQAQNEATLKNTQVLNKLEQIDFDFKQTAIEYMKEQLKLIDDQKKYSITIKRATVITSIATAIMALAIIFQVYLLASPTKNTDEEILKQKNIPQQQLTIPPQH